MRKVKLALGTHNHQPVGNFDFVFEDAYAKAYLPFIEILERHPQIKVSQHYTGILLDWFMQKYPEFIGRLKALVKRGQIEMISGGFYEPILINIPDADKLGQIAKLTQTIKEQTGYNATGFWLAERIWEPHLASILSQAHMRYTIIDDSHFKSAGLQDEELRGYYITEDKGETLNIFPIAERLRYTIPFQDPEVTIEYLRSIASEDGNNLVVFADDGEKFGIWPDTYKHCYENGWIERFFRALEANLDWIELVHFQEVLNTMPPIGRVYLPTASYREMMEWALPTKTIHEYEDFEHQLRDHNMFNRYKVFVHGGFWRNFLAKYPESNNLHKKSIYVNQKLEKVKGAARQSELFSEAQDKLWAGQCNCPYWHGVFGGLYLNNLRFAVYRSMIEAETKLDQLTRSKTALEKGWIDIQQFDFDADGQDEIIVETATLNGYFSPAKGGSLFELDFKPAAINLLDTMSRHEEAYHRKLLNVQNNHHNNNEVASIHDRVVMKEDGLDKRLHYDWFRRCSLIDHFLTADTTLDEMAIAKNHEAGDFVTSAYNVDISQEKAAKLLHFSRVGFVNVDGRAESIKLDKIIKFDPKNPQIDIKYRLRNQTDRKLDLWFGIDFIVALLAGNAHDRYFYIPGHNLETRNLASTGIVSQINQLSVVDEWLGIDVQFSFDRSADVWRYPIETISQSEGGFERVYQSSVVFPNWKIQLLPDASWELNIVKHIKH
ncbi:DUF1926 domain-containing protein [candidate division KSB1 bacterium]|nr:DUF1926 domain-containing protein [candidate division KSB1 bacterium]